MNPAEALIPLSDDSDITQARGVFLKFGGSAQLSGRYTPYCNLTRSNNDRSHLLRSPTIVSHGLDTIYGHWFSAI